MSRKSFLRKQTPLHYGWLTKQGGMVKNWKPRWFSIRGDHICYYLKEDEVKLLGDIPLPGNEVVELPANPDDPGKFFFQIKPGKDRTYVNPNHAAYTLYAKSEGERQEWISVIHRVMYSHVGGGVFGQSIQESMEYERRIASGRVVPRIVENCIGYLRTHGIETEGIFRLPGGASTIRRLKQEYNSAQPCILEENGADVHSVASLLKLYLRELPEPVIPFKYYEVFTTMGMKIQWAPDSAMALLHEKLSLLPRDNYNCLKYLCSFLHDVCATSDLNRMTDSNIAMIFGPNLLRTDDENPILMLSTSDMNTLTVRALIANYQEIFQREYYDVEVSQRRGGVHDINNVDEVDLLTGNSPESSGLPSPILPSKHFGEVLAEFRNRKNSYSSANEEEESRDSESRDDVSRDDVSRDSRDDVSRDSRDDVSRDSHDDVSRDSRDDVSRDSRDSRDSDEQQENICFRVSAVSRDSRKKTKRFNIMSQKRPQAFLTRSEPPKPSPRRRPEVPKRTTSVTKNSSNDDGQESSPEACPVEAPILEQSSPAVDVTEPVSTTDSTVPVRPSRRHVSVTDDVTDGSSVNDDVSFENDVVITTDYDDVTTTDNQVELHQGTEHEVDPEGDPPGDPSAEVERLHSQIEKLVKTQASLGRIYQRQMDAQLGDLEQHYELKLKVLNEKLKQEKYATNLAMERLSSVKEELEKYQLKYGPLHDVDSDIG